MKEAFYKVALAQGAPVWWDAEGTYSKTEVLAERAAAAGAKLIVFGECWFSGYPAYLDHCPGVALWNDTGAQEVYAQLWHSALAVPGMVTDRIGKLCKRLGMGMVVGANERVEAGYGAGSVYNAMLVFNEYGELVVHHRKLMPTYTEKLVHALGDGHGLRVATIHGARVGGLICWEHWMPLPRQVLHTEGEQVHVALWPWVHDMHQVACRQYAFEGRCFVLGVGQVMQAEALPQELLAHPDIHSDQYLLKGGSVVVAPTGTVLAGPLPEHEELLFCDLDLSLSVRHQMTLATAGHYSRPDVFQLTVNKTRPGGYTG